MSLELGFSRTDPDTKLPILEPDSIPVKFVVRNRGSITAPAGEVQLSFSSFDFNWTILQRPALRPGELYRDSVMLTASQSGGSSLTDDRVTVGIATWADGDSIGHNNTMSSPIFHLAIPLLQLTFTTVASTTVGSEIPLTIVARNYGRHADAPAQTITGCLYDSFSGCHPRYRTTTSVFVSPPVPAGTAVEFNASLTIPASATWQDATVRYSLYLCPSASGNLPGYFTGTGPFCHRNSRSVEVVPNYEAACAPPLLVDPNNVALPAFNCGLRPSLPGFENEARQYRFHLVALDAVAGETYVLQRSDVSALVRIYDAKGRAVIDLDPDPERIRVANSERIYLVMYSKSEALTVAVLKMAEVAQ